MEDKQFSKEFGNTAVKHGFLAGFGGWYLESPEVIVTLNLQKSKFRNACDLNIKIYIQGIFGRTYRPGKELIKDIGDVFRRQPKNYDAVFSFEHPGDHAARLTELDTLFEKFINPFTRKALSKAGIKALAENNEVALLPAVKAHLDNA